MKYLIFALLFGFGLANGAVAHPHSDKKTETTDEIHPHPHTGD